ncbi:hypothetical protein TrRE_jg1376, partial [Triparma retinervis]
MPSLVEIASTPPKTTQLENLRSTKPDPRVVIYDSVELFSYTRDIDSLNTALSLHGAVAMNSRLHSRVAVASLHQTICKPQIHYPHCEFGPSPESPSYAKSPAGHVGSVLPDLRDILQMRSPHDQIAAVEDLPDELTLDCFLPCQFDQALADFDDLLSQLKRTDACRWVMPKLTVDKEIWGSPFDPDADDPLDDRVVSGRSESPLFTNEYLNFRSLFRICKCLAYLRILDPLDPSTGNKFLSAVLETFLDPADPIRGTLMKCVKAEHRNSMPKFGGGGG